MVETECVITNGYVSPDTIEAMTDKGFLFVATVPAQAVHPFALPTDKATFFARYTPLRADEGKEASP